MDIKNNLEENIEIYAGMTIQKRAIVDARDALKPSARLSIYSQYIDKLLPNKPFEKSSVSVASAMRHFYPYGDAALYSMLARMGKPFAMRYKLEDFQGSTGDITEDDNQAAMRYTNMRLAKLAMCLFEDVEKNTIEKWYNSYTDKEQYPSVLPSKGYYNIVNGSMGLAYAIAASIPQFNLKEVNEALIKLLNNPNIDEDELICMPDFATGCTLLNANEVRESLKKGHGKACKLRANVTYDSEERTLIFTNTPYGTYTGTIAEQIQKIKLSEDNPGIENFWDQSTNDAAIKVLVSKKANPEKVIKYLFKNTSLQNHYGINLIMLDKGKTPKVFTWKEALEAHLEHEKIVYRRGFEFDLQKVLQRLNVVEGLLIALANIDEVVKTIKSSPTAVSARQALIDNFQLNEVQAKAILDMKLSRLAHLEIEKLEKEKEDLLKEQNRIKEILSNKELLYKEIEKGYREVAEKFGDGRRTKIMNLNFNNDEDDEEPIEEKELYIYLTNEGNLYTNEVSTLYTQKRGGRGAKLKMGKNEYIITSQQSSNANILLAFSNKGKVYSLNLAEFPTSGRVNIGEFFTLDVNEQIINIAPCGKKDKYKSVVFVTKNGLIKKTDFSEYKIKKSKGVIAIKLKDDDKLISTMFINNENVGFLTKQGNFLIIDIEKINSIGRATSGVKGIKLSENDEVVCARKIKANCKEIVSITKNALISRTNRNEFEIGTRATKGSKIQKIKEDELSAFLPIDDKDELLVVSNKGIINIRLNDVNITSRGAIGNKAKKLITNEYITNIM